MAKSMTELEVLGERVAGALGSYRAQRERAIEQAHRGFLDAALRKPAPKARAPRYWALAAAALLAAAVALVVAFRAPAPLTFTANGKEIAPETWIAAPERQAVPVSFSDGTALRVEPASRVRVVAIDEHGASIALENGSVHAEVVHRSGSAWRLIAGPLTVRVTGTRFDLHWSAATEEFFLSVEEGSVAVKGSVVGAERPVRAGETLRVFVGEQRLELTSGSRVEQVAASAPEETATAAQEEGKELQEDSATAPSKSGSTPAAEVPEWRALAQSGSLRKAYAAAEASGFDAACQAASPAELLLLGDAARLSGRADRANQALQTLRKRYPADPRRAAAAFALGKVAFDQTRSYAQAADWFRTSIREQPGGSLAREAAGRLIEALQRAGDVAGARRASEDYLTRYPNGPHADVARSVLR